VPFLAVSYEDKVAEFMRAIGRGEQIIELRQFDFETAQQKLRVWIPWR
jgi:polysaccharide pyruvyl transferase WcaK-like protein